MLNSDTKTYHFPINAKREICVISSAIDNYGNLNAVLMTYLADEEEQELEEKSLLTLTRNSREYEVTLRNIYCFGEVNFIQSGEDYDSVADMNILSQLVFAGIKIPANYDYVNNIVNSNVPYIKWYDTVFAEDVVQWCHGLLGKPNKIVLFKYNTNIRKQKAKEKSKSTTASRYQPPRKREKPIKKRVSFSIRFNDIKPIKQSKLIIKIKK